MDATVDAFFAGNPADPEQAAAVLQSLSKHVPEILLEHYQAAAADFFEWLKAPNQEGAQ
jgi:hypothetical protein